MRQFFPFSITNAIALNGPRYELVGILQDVDPLRNVPVIRSFYSKSEVIDVIPDDISEGNQVVMDEHKRWWQVTTKFDNSLDGTFIEQEIDNALRIRRELNIPMTVWMAIVAGIGCVI